MIVSPPASLERVGLDDISAGWRYSSGAGHYATDYRMPDRTPLFAVRRGKILDCQDGVVDYTPSRPGNTPGQPGANSPSNWILLRVIFRGRPATVYYQHLSDTLVKRGDWVSAGQRIGLSGQTGNATGPHLHIAAMWGGNYTRYTRYAYMLNNPSSPPPDADSVCIYPPRLLWSTADIVSLKNLGVGRSNHDVLQTQKAMKDILPRFDYSSGPGVWGKRTQEAWEECGRRSGRDGLARLAWIGLNATRAHGITAIA
jgi:murein DD-endopeptidase MepM/ murein hydrolase activator NlpD